MVWKDLSLLTVLLPQSWDHEESEVLLILKDWLQQDPLSHTQNLQAL
jgi:hypothetical protein